MKLNKMISTKVKNIINILVQFLISSNIQTTLKCYLVKSGLLLNNIINIIKLINFKKIFTIQNCLKYIIIFLDFLINILTVIRNYNIIEFFNYIEFYIEYLIDRYYYGLTVDHLAYKCLLSVDYFDKALKYFMKKNYKITEAKSSFLFFLVFVPSVIFIVPIYFIMTLYLLGKLDSLKAFIGFIILLTYAL